MPERRENEPVRGTWVVSANFSKTYAGRRFRPTSREATLVPEALYQGGPDVVPRWLRHRTRMVQSTRPASQLPERPAFSDRDERPSNSYSYAFSYSSLHL